ncbi:MAG: alanine racemase [Candidatus Coatesbacteria bacterium]
MTRTARVVVDLTAIKANARALRRAVPGAALIAVVKRDAYGHGAPEVGHALAGLADLLAVADPGEAFVLRAAGIRTPVLVLGTAASVDLPALIRAGCHPTLTGERDLAAMPEPRGGVLAAHLKFDTGMGRLGFDASRAAEVVRLLRKRRVRRLAGIWTHLAAAGEPGFTRVQLRRFDECLGVLRTHGIDPGLTHAANSGAVLASVRARGYRAIRPGLLLYGCAPGGARPPRWLRPAMSFGTRVADVRRVARGATVSYDHTWRASRAATLAILPAGYADGFSRLQSNRGTVLIRGRFARVRGLVCMNLTIVDVTDIPGVVPGDEAVFFGAQRGRRLNAGTVARRQHTIAYEVLCTAGGLNRREYGAARG